VDDAVYSELIGLNNKLIRQFNKALETVTVEELYQPEYPSMKEGIDLLTELREYFVANNLITSYAE